MSLFANEPDPILYMIKRIMHSEGDTIELSHQAAIYIKDYLTVLSLFFKEEKEENKDNRYELNMPLLTYVFEESVKRFYSHKVIKKIAKSALGVDGQQAENNELRELDE